MRRVCFGNSGHDSIAAQYFRSFYSLQRIPYTVCPVGNLKWFGQQCRKKNSLQLWQKDEKWRIYDCTNALVRLNFFFLSLVCEREKCQLGHLMDLFYFFSSQCLLLKPEFMALLFQGVQWKKSKKELSLSVLLQS